MQQKLIPDYNNVVELHKIDYNNRQIHFFSYNGQNWYFVRELTRVFRIETFRHFSNKTKVTSGVKMYVKVSDTMDTATILNSIVHVQGLQGVGNTQIVSRSISAWGSHIAAGRFDLVALSEAGVMTAIKNSPYSELILQALGISVTEGSSSNFESASSKSVQLDTSNMVRRTINMTTEIGSISLNVMLNDRNSKQAKFIMENISEIALQMCGGGVSF